LRAALPRNKPYGVREMSEEQDKLGTAIRTALEPAQPWTKVKTTIPGIFVVKIPDNKGFRVSLMFNPPDDEGEPKKRKGLYFDDLYTARTAKEAFNDDSLETLIGAVRGVNHPSTATPVLDTKAAARATYKRY
jgi:hypothetical protein